MGLGGIKNKLKKNKLARLASAVLVPNPYIAYYKKQKIREDVVLYESFYGQGMSCSPKAIFDELMSQERDLKHVWVYNSEVAWRPYFDKYKSYGNVLFVRYKSRRYYKYLASAKYLVNNSTFPQLFTKKTGQIYINTWHGIPLKKMGYDMPNGNIEVANTERNFLMSDYLISPNPHQTKMYTKAYKLDGIYDGKILELGQPRCDTLLKGSNSIKEMLEQAGVFIKKDKKIVLYAPTWKGESFSNPETDVDLEEFYNTIMETVGDKYQLLIKPHQAVYKKISENNPKLKDKMIPPIFDTNEVLSIVDVLVSDYSSIFFDYLVTGKPILFYIPDLEKYRKERGLTIDISKLPGPATSDLEQLVGLIYYSEEVLEKSAENYIAIRDEMCVHDNGKVAAKIVKAVWDKDLDDILVVNTKNDKKRIFISLGRALQNGITHSYMNLLNNIDYEKYDVTAYLYEAVADDQVERINEINKNVRVLIRCNFLFAGRWDLVKMAVGLATNLKLKVFPEKYLLRQAKRIAGDTHFDAVIEFCGYSPILAMMLPYMNCKRTAIWMHNDLLADANRVVNKKKPLKRKMAMVFNNYKYWDRLVSCSSAVMEVNKKNLSNSEIEDKFYYAKNTLNYQRIFRCLSEEPDYGDIKMPNPEEINFVTMGRMSTEKNHSTLIRAFAKFNKECPKSKLYIIGDGPLREEVKKTIEDCQIGDNVILTGNLMNPFKLMSKCSCFVLPSLYEGQPMVLLEARVVGLPIVVSDFSSVKDCLIENGQYLIKSDETSIIEGLKAFRDGLVPDIGFDPMKYNSEAFSEFENAIFRN